MNQYQERAPTLFDMASFISEGRPRISEHTMHQARRVVADTVGVAYSGVKTQAFKMALEDTAHFFGEGGHEIWATSKKTGLSGAVFYNTLSVSSTDFDEGHRMAVGHPASAVVATALNLGIHLNKTYAEVLKSVIIGYEIACRFSLSRVPALITTYSSGRWASIGTAATAASLLGLSTEQCMHALSNAAVLAPGMLSGSTDVNTGSMSKEGVAWSVQSGLQSALMARRGFVGPWLFVDDHEDYVKESLTKELGRSWLIDRNYFKPYACCRWLHSAASAIQLIRSTHAFENHEVNHIECMIFQRAINLVRHKYPENTVQAQFHLPYIMAAMLHFGKLTPECFHQQHLTNMSIRTLINKISLKPHPPYHAVFPDQLPSAVRISLNKGTILSQEVIHAPWDANDPPSDDALFKKFIAQSGPEGKPLWDQLMTI